MNFITFEVYRFNPESGLAPQMQTYTIDLEKAGCVMVLHALIYIKDHIDESLAFRHSCHEAVCGSDGLNINGKNQLACITPILTLKQPIKIRPLPGLPVLRDLIVDMDQFYKNYEKIEPYLKVKDNNLPPTKERLQSPAEREKLDGLYECIQCGCCSTSCPSWWWNPDKFLGPAAALAVDRFVSDSRDQATEQRLEDLTGSFEIYRCRGIMNCIDVCPKNLNPRKSIQKLQLKQLGLIKK